LIPKPPTHLDKEAKKEWRRRAAELHRIGILTSIDVAALMAYCQNWSQARQAWMKLAEEENGPVVLSPAGYPMLNPWWTIKHQAEDRMMKAAVELGMTPSSRRRVNVDKPKQKSAEDEFLEGSGAVK
jgi:P27 family predicted phage terminase small subunit